MSHYRVTGFALVPVEVAVRLEAVSEADAKTIAKTLFRENTRKYIIPGSSDESAAFDFIPSECQHL